MSVLLYRQFFKRFYDILLSILALIVLSPIIILATIIIKTQLGSPVIFRQLRIGKNEKSFVMYKFRSMTNAVDDEGNLLPDKQRIGKYGLFLRSSSIDELPALVNIIKGDMSIIGPRPLPVLYQPYFYESERKRHTIRGGLSGLAQVNGRNSLSWEERFSYDLQYVEKYSLFLDIKIVFLTVIEVFRKKNIGLRGISGPEDFNTYRSRTFFQE